MRAVPYRAAKFIVITACAFLFPLAAAGQSTDSNFPTAVTTNEIAGTIKARDIGDSRVTTFYYAFDGAQGDVFVNVVTTNFAGDIDVFAREGLRPLTKMVIYPDGSVNETGRVIYMRKPERLILRVEGRSPNDDAAAYRIKFAGSFVALAPQKQSDAPTTKPEVDADSGVRVNSVGTIVAVIPKPQPSPEAKPTPKETVAEVKKSPPAPEKPKPANTQPAKKESTIAATKPKAPAKTPAKTAPTKKAEEPVRKPDETAKKEPAPVKNTPKKTSGEVSTILKKTPKPKTPVSTPAKPEKKTPPPAEPKPDPLASIHLVVQFKDGKVIERPMSEVQKFSVDNSQLTVIAKDGTTVKYSILDVAKVTIE